MENPCRIVCFGDSITKAWVPIFKEEMKRRYPDYRIDVLNMGVVSDTTVQALHRIRYVLAENPDVVLVGFGMNDLRKGVDRATFKRNLSSIARQFHDRKIRSLFLTINPDYNSTGRTSKKISVYNQDIVEIAHHYGFRIIDIFSAFTERVTPVSRGLYDEIHPNDFGNGIIVKELLDIVPLSKTVIVWTFNGEYCFCNYKCPYCYVPPEVNTGHAYQGNPEKWHRALKTNFGNEKLVFYFSFGEPMASLGFYEILEMIGSESRWEAHITTNLSMPLDRLLRTRLLKENRFHLNASFHPTETDIAPFTEKLLSLRKHGTEASVIYVMYPTQIFPFIKYFSVFNKLGFFVHVRRFRGNYNGLKYPQAYTSEERQFITQFCDSLTVKYMLNDMECNPGETSQKLSNAGMNYFMLDHEGNIWLSPDYKGTHPLWNIFKDRFKPYSRYIPYGGSMLGSVNIIASLKETRMRQLEGNFTWFFAQQGGCYRDEAGKLHYPHLLS